MKMRIFAVAFLGVCLVQASENLWAQPFSPPGPTTDSTQSMGQFTIVVNPNFQPALSGVMGYNGSGTFTSGNLFDQQTQINRSMTTTVGSPGYLGGLPVGSATGLVVANSSITAFPPGYVPPQTGTDMVFTQIKSFDLTNGALSVTAGTAAPTALPASVGEVISNAGSATIGNPSLDFPAKSFFDIFVDITIPNIPAFGGTGSTTLTNAPVTSGTATISGPTMPLIIMNSGIKSFPPVVIYVHGNSTAVPLYVGAGGVNGTGVDAGDLFGLLTIAGHGAGYGVTSGGTDQNTGAPANTTTFNQAYSQMTQIPVLPSYPPSIYPGSSTLPTGSWAPGVVVLPEPSSVSLLALAGAGAIGLRLRRGRRRPTVV
jgi:hypothetical protein